jgi:hypothetical protein
MYSSDAAGFDIAGVSLLVAFRLAGGVDLRTIDFKYQTALEFQEHLANVDLFSFLYRVCLYETRINASSVYFDDFDNKAAENLQHADEAPLFCIKESDFAAFSQLSSSHAISCYLDGHRQFFGVSHDLMCTFEIDPLAIPVLNLDELPPNVHNTSLIPLRVGRVYRLAHTFSLELQDTTSDDQSLRRSAVLFASTQSSYVMLRNRINFVYIIQHDVFCDASHLRHKDAEVLVVAWKHGKKCADGCLYFPNSTQNEGRNAAWESTFVRWPGTVFTYYIFLDGDTSLVLRPERSSLPPITVANGVGSHQLPFRSFEQHLLHYNPAVGFPYYSGWHKDDGEEVQFASNYDHIMVAIHQNVSRLYLPTETRFDDVSWWYGQRIHAMLSSVAFKNQTMQFNTLVSENGSVGKKVPVTKNSITSRVCAAGAAQESNDDVVAAVESKTCTHVSRSVVMCCALHLKLCVII